MEYVIAITALLGLLLTIIKVWPWFQKSLGITKLQEKVTKIEENTVVRLENKIDAILEELRPNGGSSIKDAIARIETRQIFSSQRQKSLMQTDVRGIFELDINGEVIWCNASFVSMTGASTVAELLGNGWHSFLCESIHSDWAEAIEMKRQFRGSVAFESGFCANIETQVLKDDFGGVIGYLCYATPAECDPRIM